MSWLTSFHMNPKTYIVDFIPTITKETPSQLRKKEYAENLLNSYDLGEVIICTFEECKKRGVEEQPDVIICTYEYGAQEIKELIPESVLYVAESANSVFSRKAEMDKKMEENIRIFEDASRMVKHIREATDEERVQMRKVHGMSYKDTYKMIQRALISDDENIKKQAWDLLWGPGEKHKNIIWMRVQMMAEVWEHAKGKALEDLMLMSMERHVDYGIARKMDNFTDLDGREYHQYMFLDPYGNDYNYIRRMPCATKNQDRYAYENLLEECEMPKNYLRIQLEADQIRKQWDEYLAVECEKVSKVLEKWKEDPKRSKKELGVAPWEKNGDVEEPLTERELESLNNFLKKYQKT